MILLQAAYTTTLLTLLYLVIRSIYRLSPAHSLSRIPGPFLPRLSSLWLVYHAWIGDECTAVHKLHQKYGPIVRTGPSSVDIADGEALQTTYVDRSGFRKASFYRNFDIDGHASIFSELDNAPRAARAKAVAALFSTADLRQGQGVIDSCITQWIDRIRAAARSGRPVNVLDLARSLAVDVVSSYLFGKQYGGLTQPNDAQSEGHEELSASGMVNSFVAVGRYWYLPTWAFNWLAWAESKLYPDWKVFESIGVVDAFVEEVVDTTVSEKQQGKATYQGKLLDAGFNVSEVKAQCKDLMFAGTDSTGMNLATILFMLAKHPETYTRLCSELKTHPPDTTDIQSLPYLRGVIREGLRISMANPSRLPRVVPRGGWTFKGTYFPDGTEVSCTPFELHFNPTTFPDPHEFRPERWLNPTDEMSRDAIPWGLGLRQCIARNLATWELYAAVPAAVRADVLNGATCCHDKIEILEWFNSKVMDEKIELVWASL
ncbi:Pisatin demethylase [Cyphellophora attinorum]|uniref:Pisatin demethylase n=1 Tax=Cyphellophora attinorum TaxID=1664694 RepID=A0A0N1P2B6_9EURO|nr:Pisatin demethylase [Phialophora attinorum]KPI42167.1 Pisatin demethylase [Phialophora attinorum]